MASPPQLQKRQVTLGPDLDGFEVTERAPADNLVNVGAGFFTNHSDGQVYQKAAQTAGPFGAVSGAGRVRWDLVYLDDQGVAQVEAGAEQITPVADYTGAPGNGSPFTAATVFPLAWVQVDEAGGVVVIVTDITLIRAYMNNLQRGVVGSIQSDNTAGAVAVLGTNWNRVPIDHQHVPNVDGVNPEDVELSGESPGSLFVYSRRDHIHKLSAAAQASLATPHARSTTCLFACRDQTVLPNNNNYNWLLHQFQGRAWNDATFWFDIDPSVAELLTLFPVDAGGTGNNIGPGGADDTDALQVNFQNGWLYAYAIGAPNTGAVALVYSTNDPTVGPGLTDPAFTGGADVYTVWRLVTCIEGDGSATPKAVPMVKYDNYVQKIQPTGSGKSKGATGNCAGHAEDLLWTANLVTTAIDMSEHVSPIAMCAFVNTYSMAQEDGGPSTVNAELEWNTSNNMGIFEQCANCDAFIKEIYNEATVSGDEDHNYDGFWLQLDATRKVNLTVTILNSALFAMCVIGYIELTDYDLANVAWGG